MDEAGCFGLTPIQEGMLFHHLAEPGSGVDIEQIEVGLPEGLDPAALKRAWQLASQAHEPLRTVFEWRDRDAPGQRVLDAVEPDFREEDWRDVPAAEQQERLAALLEAERERGFDFAVAPLSRQVLVRRGEAEWTLLWTFHHVLLDGRSFPLVLGDVFDAYAALRRGEEPRLPQRRPFRDFVAWQATLSHEASRAFWRERLEGFAAPTPLPKAASVEAGSALSPGVPRQVERRLDRESSAALERLAQDRDLSVNVLVQGAWALLLARHSGAEDVVFGATRACRRGSVDGADEMSGCFINTPPLRARIDPERPMFEWLGELRDQQRALREHEHTPLVEIQAASAVPAGTPLFESILVFDHDRLETRMHALGEAHHARHYRLLEKTHYALTLYGYAEPELRLELGFDPERFALAAAERLLAQLATLLRQMARMPDAKLGEFTLLDEHEERRVAAWSTGATLPLPLETLSELFASQASRTPERTALVFEDAALSYAELAARAGELAARLRACGVGPGARVGLCVERGLDLPVALLGILAAGGAYVPLDPEYPRERLAFVIEDAGLEVLVSQPGLRERLPEFGGAWLDVRRPEAEPPPGAAAADAASAAPEDLAYLIYTSGSTGQPKGVMVEHRQVASFFRGMDALLAPESGGTWLAVTSLSFDISVLELLWTLTRGFSVVVQGELHETGAPAAHAGTPMDFGLFYFASGEGAESRDKYRLLLEGARFADANGFSSVWTPERHFHAFGGLYPNPAVTGAAVAAVTERVAIRGGSVVLPLHHPIRIAEEWALVDNLSDGRVGIAFASGWQPNDFVLAPENFSDAKGVMLRGIETVRRLWRGEVIEFPGPKGDAVPIRTLPRPVQAELPYWITTAGNPETWRAAGEAGAGVLTHLLGQSVEEVAEKVVLYREARRAAGHPGEGVVSLMLHTFVGEDEDTVRETVRAPMKAYLESSVSLIRDVASSIPLLRGVPTGSTKEFDEAFRRLSPEDVEAILDHSFERYYETSGLFGTPERCLAIVDRLKAAGVNEIACLLDFGVDSQAVLDQLPLLAEVRRRANPEAGGVSFTPGAQLARHAVSHLQCTPSMARLLVRDPEARRGLAGLRTLLVGGEAFPPDLAAELRELVPGAIHNVYGPTEATVWSTHHTLGDRRGPVPIGRPLANQSVHVLDAGGRRQPAGVAGELWIGGAGVTRGYHRRPELTAERFQPDPFAGEAGARMYRTGDLVRWSETGELEFLGRIDHQVKIRGHRIELGEIEAALAVLAEVAEVVVVAREAEAGDQRLVAYCVPAAGGLPEAAVLRERLRQRLPEFMLPSHFVALESLPQTPNRKVDRKALPAPEAVAAPASAAFTAPASELERSIAEVWKEVLGVPRVGLDDNFFDLGGHSLLTVRVHDRLVRRVEKPLAVTDLFRFPTVRSLAAHLGGEADTESRADRGRDRGRERAAARRAAMGRRRRER